MVWLGSPTTQTSARPPSQASSSRCCSGFTSWYSSTTKWRYCPRISRATAGCSSALLGRLVARVHRGDGGSLEGRLPPRRLRTRRIVVGCGQRRLGPFDLAGQVTQAGAVGGQPRTGGGGGHQAQFVLHERRHR